MKSLGYYTQSMNTGVEYAVREDGAVFSREKFWSTKFGRWSTDKWKRNQYFDSILFPVAPTKAIGFAANGHHVFIPSTRLRLPVGE